MSRKTKIFMIDDEPDILDAVKIILESEGYEVKTTQFYDNAAKIEEFAPNIIILDALLQGQTGSDVCLDIRKNSTLRNVPIVLFSALPLSKLKQMVINSGADGYLQKPFEIDDLISLTKKYLV